jgi:hypothetical protein
MRDFDAHLSDEELLLAPDGESHLADCFQCRARLRELENAAADVARLRRESLDPALPSHAAARSRLRARLSEAAEPQFWPWRWRRATALALALACAAAILSLHSRASRWAEEPSPRLTPGKARVVDRIQLCNSPLPKNQEVPADLRRRVFQAYGLANADPRKFEVDYLITPALGGADDIRNLWPEPYVSTVWNARVKDELEDRLHDLVCQGEVDLADAQRDISTDWIAAYKKYFGTDAPER